MFGRIASLLYESDDFEAIYQKLCDAAVHLIPGCHHASLMVQQGSRFVTAAASDDVARRADDLEREVGDVPDEITIETVEQGALLATLARHVVQQQSDTAALRDS